MTLNLRTVLTVAVPVVTSLFGILWLFTARKPKSSKKPNKSEEQETAGVSSDVTTNIHQSETGERNGVVKDEKTSQDVRSDQKEVLETQNVCDVSKLPSSEIQQDVAQVFRIEEIEEKRTESTAAEVSCPPSVEEKIIIPLLSSSLENSLEQNVPNDSASDKSQNSSVDESLAPVSEEIVSEISVKVECQPTSSSPATTDLQNPVLQTEPQKIEDNCLSSQQCDIEVKCGQNSEESHAGPTSVQEKDITACIEPANELGSSWSEEVEKRDFSQENHKTVSHSSSVCNGEESGDSAVCSDKSCDKSNTVDLSSPNRNTDGVCGLHPPHERNGEILSNSDSLSTCDSVSEASNDSGKGASMSESPNAQPLEEDRVFEFNMPSDLCGLFIGSRGKTIKSIRDMSGTKIKLKNNPYTLDFQICVIEGKQSAIDQALNIIRKKFPSVKYPGMDLTPINQQVNATNPVLVPEIMQLSLPEGVSVDVVVSSIVDAGRIFVQQPTHPTFPSLERLNQFMNACYMQDGGVPDIPRPIENGVICAAPMLNGWYRAQIMAANEDMLECDIKYVDYGGYSRVSCSLLKQIRSDFMTLPFEAVECYMANITPLQNETYFSPEAAAVLEELTQGKLLQAQVVGRSDDGIPYVHIYQISGSMSALMVNRELVNRGVARWIEILS